MRGIQDTSTDTYRKIMGNGLTYEVPKFQRDYSWNTEHWDDLWQDLMALHEGEESAHYMGYLVLQTSDDKRYRIIDGQQRITTISILILATLQRLAGWETDGVDAARNRLRREQLRNSYIGFLDAVSLVPTSKLQLNRNNNNFYQTYLVPLQPIPIRGLNASERLMKRCFKYFKDRIAAKFSDGEMLTRFVDKFVDQLFFTVITVGDDLNAYKVFETLNARGVKLSSADLLKNYLFSLVDAGGTTHPAEFEQLESLWAEMIAKLGGEKLPDFLRYYWNSRNKLTRSSYLFKRIKQRIHTKQQVFQTLRELVTAADVYIALRNPYDEFWKGDKTIQRSLSELRLFGARQTYALLMSGYEKLNDSRFKILLRSCVVFYFRYNIIGGGNPGDEERLFNEVANDIQQNERFTPDRLRSLYPNDEQFSRDFANKSFTTSPRNLKLIKYILTRIENHLRGTDLDVISDRNSVEHILPQQPGEEWVLDDAAIERMRERLGNTTLLERGKNRDLKNIGYAAKREVFAKSEFAMTQRIAEEYADWNEAAVNQHQHWLAKQAGAVWRM